MDRREFLKLSGMAAAGLSSFDPRLLEHAS
jgi:hypothetical protein